MKDIIAEIWEIRGIIDGAIEAQDKALFDVARKRFNKLFTSEAHLKTIATSTVNIEFEDLESLNLDRETNFAMLAYRLSCLGKNLENVERNGSEFQFSSVLEVLWYTRGMYDTFELICSGKIEDTEHNQQLLFNAIEHNLKNCCEYYDDLDEVASIVQERETMHDLYVKFIEKYNQYEIDTSLLN